MLFPSIFLTKAVHLITLLDNLGLKRTRIVSLSSSFSPVSLRNWTPVLDKFEILTCSSGGSLLEKQVPVNKTRLRKDLLFSKITRIVFVQLHSISQFWDISVSAKRITLALLHEGHITSAFSLPITYTFIGSIALRCWGWIPSEKAPGMSKVHKSYNIRFRHTFSAGSGYRDDSEPISL